MLNNSMSADFPVIVAEHHRVDDSGDCVTYGLMEGHDTRGIDTNNVVIYVSHASREELRQLRILAQFYGKVGSAKDMFHDICIGIRHMHKMCWSHSLDFRNLMS